MTVPWTEKFLQLLNYAREFSRKPDKDLIQQLNAYERTLKSVGYTICSRPARQEYEQRKAELDDWYEEELVKINKLQSATCDKLKLEMLEYERDKLRMEYLNRWCELLEYIEGKYVLSNPETTEV
jgi:hypothetical protein